MKRLLLALLIVLCLIPSYEASGAVTLANLRLSLSSTAPFVDFSAVGTLAPYLGYKLTLIDSGNKKSIGYIRSAGTAETLGNDLISDPLFNSASDWTAGASWGIAGGVATGTAGGTGSNLQNTSGTATVPGALYKTVTEIASRTAGNILIRYPARTGNFFAVATHTNYICNESGVTGKPMIQSSSDTFTGTITSFSVKQVLTPSATGVTISWASIESGFLYNDASGYTYTITPISQGNYNLGFGFGF